MAANNIPDLPPVPRITPAGFEDPVWPRWLDAVRNRIITNVAAFAFNNANGFAGSVAVAPNGTATLTLGVSVSGLLKGVGGALTPAVDGTDYLGHITATGDATGTNVGDSLPLTLATVNPNVGTWNNVTVNGKGLVTAATNQPYLLSANTVAGTYNNVAVNSDGLVTAGSNIPYLTGNQTITLSGDASGSGATSIAVTLATVNANIGTYNNVTVNGKGLVTAASNVPYLTGNQNISVTGDATGSGATAIALTLATVNSNVGTFNSVTVNAKGLVTAASNVAYPGRLLAIRSLSNGTYTPTTGTNNVLVVMQAPGGGGGGTAATSAGQSAAASGGGAGSYVKAYFPVSALTGLTVSLGTAGTGNSGAAGTAGTNATFGSAITCPGGVAGNAASALSAPGFVGGTASAAAATVTGGTVIESVPGIGGDPGFVYTAGSLSMGGRGGWTPLGVSAQPKPGLGNNSSTSGYGFGGGGANAGASQAAQTGGTAGAGFCEVWEFA